MQDLEVGLASNWKWI